eukprot:NODE_15476_length_1048_cov_4.560261.p6 GENE.NODE_15476_length_1048_cov_4.560261~~NODE_15476_length_1048_cov_4.560261.p6  ORF type:complete len:52 (-),score=7.83 NODE_15476_length_1048_cov_4.560261:444-599(-)
MGVYEAAAAREMQHRTGQPNPCKGRLPPPQPCLPAPSQARSPSCKAGAPGC